MADPVEDPAVEAGVPADASIPRLADRPEGISPIRPSARENKSLGPVVSTQATGPSVFSTRSVFHGPLPHHQNLVAVDRPQHLGPPARPADLHAFHPRCLAKPEGYPGPVG